MTVIGVAAKDPHRQRLALAVGQQSDHDLQLAALAVAVVAEFPQSVVLAFQITAGDVVEQQGGRRAAAAQITLIESLLDLLVALAEIVKSGVEIVFIESAQAENFGTA